MKWAACMTTALGQGHQDVPDIGRVRQQNVEGFVRVRFVGWVGGRGLIGFVHGLNIEGLTEAPHVVDAQSFQGIGRGVLHYRCTGSYSKYSKLEKYEFGKLLELVAQPDQAAGRR